MKMQAVICPNCNGEVQIDTSREFGFCSYCGTKIVFDKEAPLNATQAFKDNREAALDEIGRIMDYFDPLADEFEKLDIVNDQLDIMYRYNANSYAIAGLITAAVGWFLIQIVDMIGIGIAAILIGAFLIFWKYHLESCNKKSIDEYVTEKKRLSKIIIETYDACPQCPVGIEYCRPETLYDLYEYIRKGRAETIKEAINLLESDEHNAEMKKIAWDTRAIAEANLEVNTINAINNILK